MKLSVITVAYKSAEILQKSIESVFKYNDLGDELEYILVDNSPVDERVDKKLPNDILKKIIYIPADNKGFGAGNNIGAYYSKGEIIAFINPDIIFIEPVFKRIYYAFMKKNDLAILGCKLLYEDLSSGFSYYFDYKYSYIKKWTLKLWNKINYFNQNTMYISGADLFIRKDLFFKCGKFDEKIFMYYEEPDLTRRIKKIPGTIVEFDKELKLIHLEKKSTPNTFNSTKHEFESAIYYGKKYNLNYKKKILFEYRYLKIKKNIYKIINKEKYKNLVKVCEGVKQIVISKNREML